MNDQGNQTTDNKETPVYQIQVPAKKPRDYFFDFFMLFLAVTLGFFVNNLNENLSERQREKQYIRSLITDLEIDTAEINTIHSGIARRISGIDTLLNILEKRDQENFINNLYYYSLRYLNSASFHITSDRTISQLKSAGGLRLIQRKGESDRIVQYYSLADNVRFNTDYCLNEINEIMDLEKEIFDFGILRRHSTESVLKLQDLKLISDDPRKLDHFYNQVLMHTGQLINYNSLITELKKEAESLLSFTKESYRIE